MARVLVAWELGGGLGHLVRLRPLVVKLLAAGHQVTLSVRQLSRVDQLFPSMKIEFLQAPIHDGRSPNYINASTFPQVLNNTGCADPTELQALLQSWLLQFDYVRPDVVIVDHSPTALLACRIRSIPTVIAGNGFSIPDTQGCFPNWRAESSVDSSDSNVCEKRVLANINQALESRAAVPLQQLVDLYRAELTLLTDIRELDAVPDRRCEDYYCRWLFPTGKRPQWPGVPGKRVFVYLKPCNCLPHLFSEIARRGLSTIVFSGALDRRLSELFRAPNICFEPIPMNMAQVAEDCDLAILNSTHGSTLQFLLAGVPQLQLPSFLEQAITARRSSGIGAALVGNQHASTGLGSLLDMLLDDPKFRLSAQSVQARYAVEDTTSDLDRAGEKLLALL